MSSPSYRGRTTRFRHRFGPDMQVDVTATSCCNRRLPEGAHAPAGLSGRRPARRQSRSDMRRGPTPVAAYRHGANRSRRRDAEPIHRIFHDSVGVASGKSVRVAKVRKKCRSIVVIGRQQELIYLIFCVLFVGYRQSNILFSITALVLHAKVCAMPAGLAEFLRSGSSAGSGPGPDRRAPVRRRDRKHPDFIKERTSRRPTPPAARVSNPNLERFT